MAAYPFRTISARIGAAGAVLCLLLSAACSGSPTGPGAFTAGRRVLTGSGGGSNIPVCTSADLCGRVEIRAAGGSLIGTTIVQADSTSTFSFAAALSGSGRLTSGYISVDVSGDAAVINELTYERGNGVFGEQTVSTAATVTVSPDGCSDGRDLVETRITTTLENFGPVTITERHCYPLATR